MSNRSKGNIHEKADFSIFLPIVLRSMFTWGVVTGRLMAKGGQAWKTYKKGLPVLFWDIAKLYENFPDGNPP